VFMRNLTWVVVGLYIRFPKRLTCIIVYVFDWLCCFCQRNCVFILLASFNKLCLVVYQVYVQAHALGAKLNYLLKRKNHGVYVLAFFIMSFYYLKGFKYYTWPLRSEDAHSRHTQDSHSAYEIKTRWKWTNAQIMLTSMLRYVLA
jgi:hypothetical protein